MRCFRSLKTELLENSCQSEDNAIVSVYVWTGKPFFWLDSSVWCKGRLLCVGAIPLVFPHRCWLTPTWYISSMAVRHYRFWVGLERLGGKVARGSGCQFYSDPCPDLAFSQGHWLSVCFTLLPSSWHPSVYRFTAPLLWRALDIAGQPAFVYSFGQNLFWNTIGLDLIFWKPEEEKLLFLKKKIPVYVWTRPKTKETNKQKTNKKQINE